MNITEKMSYGMVKSDGGLIPNNNLEKGYIGTPAPAQHIEKNPIISNNPAPAQHTENSLIISNNNNNNNGKSDMQNFFNTHNLPLGRPVDVHKSFSPSETKTKQTPKITDNKKLIKVLMFAFSVYSFLSK